MLSDIVANAIESQPDMELVSGDARVQDTDVVVVGAAGRALDEVRPLLDAAMRTRILAITLSDGHAYLIELRPHRASLGAVSPEALVGAIRAGLGSTPSPGSES